MVIAADVLMATFYMAMASFEFVLDLWLGSLYNPRNDRSSARKNAEWCAADNPGMPYKVRTGCHGVCRTST